MDKYRLEAQFLLTAARHEISLKNFEAASAYLRRSLCLYPDEGAQPLLDSLRKYTTQGNPSGDRRERTFGSSNRHRDKTKELIRKILRLRNYYEILEVSPTASEQNIRQAYKKLALLLHPDKNSSPSAAEAFKIVNTSYSVLSDHQKRRDYDVQMKHDRSNAHKKSTPQPAPQKTQEQHQQHRQYEFHFEQHYRQQAPYQYHQQQQQKQQHQNKQQQKQHQQKQHQQKQQQQQGQQQKQQNVNQPHQYQYQYQQQQQQQQQSKQQQQYHQYHQHQNYYDHQNLHQQQYHQPYCQHQQQQYCQHHQQQFCQHHQQQYYFQQQQNYIYQEEFEHKRQQQHHQQSRSQTHTSYQAPAHHPQQQHQQHYLRHQQQYYHRSQHQVLHPQPQKQYSKSKSTPNLVRDRLYVRYFNASPVEYESETDTDPQVMHTTVPVQRKASHPYVPQTQAVGNFIDTLQTIQWLIGIMILVLFVEYAALEVFGGQQCRKFFKSSNMKQMCDGDGPTLPRPPMADLRDTNAFMKLLKDYYFERMCSINSYRPVMDCNTGSCTL